MKRNLFGIKCQIWIIIYNAIPTFWTLLHTNAAALRDWCWVGGREEV